MPQLRVAVIGSGPSGLYTAQSLVSENAPVQSTVDVFDRLPCPYGLVRYGVAPDHEKIKSLQQNLRGVLEHPRVRFLGNLNVGADGVTPRELLGLYHAVVYCLGAGRDRGLGIPGEDLPGSYAATDFVAWYSAHPDAAARRFPLHARAALVIGVGNVALDVTRILARTGAELEATDMPQGPLESLAGSAVRTVHLVGRRGPSQARFTTKELRELGGLSAVRPHVREAELARDPHVRDPEQLAGNARRNLAVLRSWSQGNPADSAAVAEHGLAEKSPAATRSVQLRFYLRPVAILGEEEGAVRGVRFERTVPDGAREVRGTGEFEDIEAALVLRSVGYRGVPLEGLPFQERTGTVPHNAGRVLREGTAALGEYVAGWIKRGPTGVIGSNRSCAKESVAALHADADLLADRPVTGTDPLVVLRRAGHELVEWPGWLAIEKAEATLGLGLARGTVKIPDWGGLLNAARGG